MKVRIVAGVDFESPILNGDGFFAQFWPGKMIYDINLDYEKKMGPRCFAAWTTHYRLDLPVDDDLPFAASLFTGLTSAGKRIFSWMTPRPWRGNCCSAWGFLKNFNYCPRPGYPC